MTDKGPIQEVYVMLPFPLTINLFWEPFLVHYYALSLSLFSLSNLQVYGQIGQTGPTFRVHQLVGEATTLGPVNVRKLIIPMSVGSQDVLENQWRSKIAFMTLYRTVQVSRNQLIRDSLHLWRRIFFLEHQIFLELELIVDHASVTLTKPGLGGFINP